MVVIVSDGWERADPSLLGEQMARLSRLAHRVIWVNPRKAAPGFAPLTGGMARRAAARRRLRVRALGERRWPNLLEAIAAVLTQVDAAEIPVLGGRPSTCRIR